MFKNKKILIIFMLFNISLSVSVNAMEEDKDLNNLSNELDQYSDQNIFSKEFEKYIKENENDKTELSGKDLELESNDSYKNYNENERLENFFDSDNGDIYDDEENGNIRNIENGRNNFLDKLDTIKEEAIESTVKTEDVKKRILELINATNEISDEFSDKFKSLIKNLVDESEYSLLCISLDYIPKKFFEQLKIYAKDEENFLSRLKKLINKKSGDVDLKSDGYPNYFKELNKVIEENTEYLEKINLKFKENLEKFKENNINKKNDTKENIFSYLNEKFDNYRKIILIYNNFINDFNLVLKDKFHFPKNEDNYANIKNKNGYIFNIYFENFYKEYQNFLTAINNFQCDINIFYNGIKTEFDRFIKQEQNRNIEFFKNMHNDLKNSSENLEIKEKEFGRNKKIKKHVIKNENLSNGLIFYEDIENIGDILYNFKILNNNLVNYREEDKKFYKIDYKKEFEYLKKINQLAIMINKTNDSKSSFSSDSFKSDGLFNKSLRSKSDRSHRSKSLGRSFVNRNSTKDLNFISHNFEDSKNINNVTTNENKTLEDSDIYRENILTLSQKLYSDNDNYDALGCGYGNNNLSCECDDNNSDANHQNHTFEHRSFNDEYMLGIGNLSKRAFDRIKEDCAKINPPILNLSEVEKIPQRYSDGYKKVFENQSNSSMNKDCKYKIKIIGECSQIDNSDINEIKEIQKLIGEIFKFKNSLNEDSKNI